MKDVQSKFLPLIALFKILKACSLFAVAFGLHHLRVGNSGEIIEHWCNVIRIDPDNKIAHSIISHLTGLAPGKLHELGIGTFFYGLLFGIEGVGLLLKQRWAEYMTVLSTVTFLPLEVFELVAKPHRKVIKAVVLVINVAILIYLFMTLMKAKRREKTLAALDPKIPLPEQ